MRVWLSDFVRHVDTGDIQAGGSRNLRPEILWKRRYIMARLSKMLAVATVVVLAYAANRQGPTIGRGYAAAQPAAAASTTRLDTVMYDDGRLFWQVPAMNPGEKAGVWITPPRGAQNCSLYAVEYFFSRSLATDSGFINLVRRYDGRSTLTSIGTGARTFPLTPSPQSTIILFPPIPVDTSNDFFIGWTSQWVDSAGSPIMLMDSMACCVPRRSYLKQGDYDSLSSMPYDFGVRAVFISSVPTPPPDTGSYTFELRWNKPKTDLDLYLILPARYDTVCWRNRSVDSIRLDVDDNDGYGPETITCPITSDPADSVMIAVHYYGPSKGKPTKGKVIIRRNGSLVDSRGWCALSPTQWWNVGTLFLATGNATFNNPCDTVSRPDLSKIRK